MNINRLFSYMWLSRKCLKTRILRVEKTSKVIKYFSFSGGAKRKWSLASYAFLTALSLAKTTANWENKTFYPVTLALCYGYDKHLFSYWTINDGCTENGDYRSDYSFILWWCHNNNSHWFGQLTFNILNHVPPWGSSVRANIVPCWVLPDVLN